MNSVETQSNGIAAPDPENGGGSRDCPICGNAAQRQWPHPDGWIWRCRECTHAFTDPLAKTHETYDDRYYSETHGNWFRNPNLRLFERIHRLMGAGPKGQSVLDVGCGRGDLLFHLHARNPSLQLTGLDLASVPSHSRIRFVSGDLFGWEPGCRFDMVTSLAVIEHVEDVRGFLERIRGMLVNGGRLVLTTLNEGSTIYLAGRGMRRVGIPGPFVQLYSRHHRHHFTRRSLHRLVEDSGYRVVDAFTHNFPLAAVDFQKRGPVLDACQKGGVAFLFGLGSLTGRGFLQTLVCER